MGFPSFLLFVRENHAHGQVEANNNVAGTAINSAEQIITVKSPIFLFINMARLLFLICHAAFITHSTRAVILSRFDPLNETFDYLRVIFFFYIYNLISLEHRGHFAGGSTTTGVTLIQ